MDKKKAKPIMIQGTMSNAGKSLLCTALCRIFAQDGYRVAPFKSQNMALNSFVTKDGLEMGRAQVAQAEACYKEPEVSMNPILLKPTTDVGSQVIVNGKSMGNMRAVEYFRYKRKLIPEIQKAYDKLSSENDIIVIEGAGSPVELNLKSDDIVNMGIAKLFNAPVLLVGDIDRGGVFAQLYGTMELLQKEERAYVKGFIVNKFRGDAALFTDGVTMLNDLLKVPCVGVAPYAQVDIDDEDSQSDRLDVKKEKKECDIHIAIVRLPRMSNYTDFNALSRYENVDVSFVTDPKKLRDADLIILPGTKSTMSDREWLKESGMEEELLLAHSEKKLIFGICGGLQLLGNSIEDFCGAEGSGKISGLGLLPVDTVFSEDKTLTQTNCEISSLTGVYASLNGTKVFGYEMHMGKSNGEGEYFIQNDTVLATYIHGCFDHGLDKAVLDLICKRKQLPYVSTQKEDVSYEKYKDMQYDLLANIMRDHLDMEAIYKIVFDGK